MVDGFWSGMFGGLFGPAIAQWLSRFKYWVIFLVATVTVHVVSFIQDCLEFGGAAAIVRFVNLVSKPVGIFAPMGIGLLVVFVAFVGSLSAPKSKSETDQDKNDS